MNRKKTFRWKIPFLLFLIVATIWIIKNNTISTIPYQKNEGAIFGTVYHATYQYPQNLQQDIQAELKKVDNSLSPFNEKSIITRVNLNKETVLDSMFMHVYSIALDISEATHGSFDITVAPLVNVWGFGFKHKDNVTQVKIDSIRNFVGYKKICLKEGRIIKQDKRTMLDCSAIAKGYGSDVIAQLFESKGIKNYMIEIGGEIVVKGKNNKDQNWKIGVIKPKDDSTNVKEELQTILNISNIAMATSGNYRNFYYKDGKKFAHTINPKTGYPVQHSILSSTVLAHNCATADAYATAFMVMGIKESQQLLAKHKEIDAYFIYADANGKMRTWCTPKMYQYMKKEYR